MQFNKTFKTMFEYILKKLVLCIQIRFVSTKKTTRIASRASCLLCKNVLWKYSVRLNKTKIRWKGTFLEVCVVFNLSQILLL